MFGSLYLDRNTVLHRLHPVTKILGLLMMFVGPLCFTRPAYLLPLAAAALALGLAAGFGPNLRRFWKLVIAFFLLSFVLWSVIAPRGEPFAQWGFLRFSHESLLYAAGMGLRIDLFLLLTLSFASITRIEEFTDGLNRMGLPYRVGFALSLAFRLVPMFAASALRVAQAQKCRGLDLDSGNILQRMRKYAPIFIPVFVGAVRGGDALALAIESRGFGASGKRTCLAKYAFGATDVGALAFAALLGGACVLLRVWGYGVV